MLPPPEPLRPIPGVCVAADSGDALVPPSGYVADFVLATKGILTPTRFCIWGAIAQLSYVVKRAAWVQWYPKPMYPNLFIIIVAGPRWWGKSDIIDIYSDALLRRYWKRIANPLIRIEKYPQIFHSKATAGSIFQWLSRRDLPSSDIKAIFPEEPPKSITKPFSDAALLMSELGTFLTQDKFNAGLIQKLNDLWSCKDEDDDTTITRGRLKVLDAYVTLFGGTTATALAEVLPQSAVSDGFVSRTIFVKEVSLREPGRPAAIVANDSEELEKRLAWIAENIRGEFHLSPDAEEERLRVIGELRSAMNRAGLSDREVEGRSRGDIHMMKIALLLHAAAYNPDPEITVEEFLQAEAIVKDTIPDAVRLILQVGASPMSRKAEAVKAYLDKRGDYVERQDLLRRFSSNHGVGAIPVKEMEGILEGFIQEGHLKVRAPDGHVIDRPQGRTHETYRWLE